MRKRLLEKLVVFSLTAALTAASALPAAGEAVVESTQADDMLPEDFYEGEGEVTETEVPEEPAEEYIDIEVDAYTESAADGAFLDETGGETEEAVESSTEMPDESSYLWQYRYAGVPNIYLQTICEWLTVYHMNTEQPGTGMIPAISVVGVDDSDRNDIRVYGHFLISDYVLADSTLVGQGDELLTGCMHLQQLSEDSYIVSKAEILDPGNPAGSARTLTSGDPSLMQGLLQDSIRREQREQYIRDFVWSEGIQADSYQDAGGEVRAIGYAAQPAPEYVANTVEAARTGQLVTVGKLSGANAVLMLHEKQADGSWLTVMDVPALIGAEGLGKTVEGDRRTPVGAYGFTVAFGTASDPGALLPYTQCDESWYYVSDPASGRYNQLVSTAEYMEFDEEASEQIAAESYAYRYALGISYNAEGTPYAGSGISLHCMKENSFSTEGGIAVSEDACATLLARLAPDAKILIDTEANLSTQYLDSGEA